MVVFVLAVLAGYLIFQTGRLLTLLVDMHATEKELKKIEQRQRLERIYQESDRP